MLSLLQFTLPVLLIQCGYQLALTYVPAFLDKDFADDALPIEIQLTLRLGTKTTIAYDLFVKLFSVQYHRIYIRFAHLLLVHLHPGSILVLFFAPGTCCHDSHKYCNQISGFHSF